MIYPCTGLTGAPSWPSSHSRGCSTVLPGVSEFRKPFAGKPTKSLIFRLSGGTRRITAAPAKRTCVIFSSSGSVFLYEMQLCLLPFFWRWCLFLSVCVDIFYSMRPHNNAFLLGVCGRVACKDCTGCTLHYSRAIKSRTISFYKKKPLYCYNIPQCHMALKSHATLFKGNAV